MQSVVGRMLKESTKGDTKLGIYWMVCFLRDGTERGGSSLFVMFISPEQYPYLFKTEKDVNKIYSCFYDHHSLT